jgi:hypothetical protein
MSANQGFSVCAWIVFDAIDSWSCVFEFGLGASNSNVVLVQDDLSNLNLSVYSCSSGVDKLWSPIPYLPGAWQHVCVVNQGRRWELYENGDLVASKISTIDLMQVDLTSNYIGLSN